MFILAASNCCRNGISIATIAKHIISRRCNRLLFIDHNHATLARAHRCNCCAASAAATAMTTTKVRYYCNIKHQSCLTILRREKYHWQMRITTDRHLACKQTNQTIKQFYEIHPSLNAYSRLICSRVFLSFYHRLLQKICAHFSIRLPFTIHKLLIEQNRTIVVVLLLVVFAAFEGKKRYFIKNLEGRIMFDKYSNSIQHNDQYDPAFRRIFGELSGCEFGIICSFFCAIRSQL